MATTYGDPTYQNEVYLQKIIELLEELIEAVSGNAETQTQGEG